MKDLANSKRNYKRERTEIDDEKMHEAMRERRGGNPVQFTAPGAEQKWRARDLVDIHWKLVGVDPPSESYNRIMSCIIGHANPRNGNCYPGQRVIAIETGYSQHTVRRAIAWWEGHKFLKKESRGLAKALAYHPQWDLLEMHWIAIAENIATEKEKLSRVASRGYTTCSMKGLHNVLHTGCYTEPQSENLKEESYPERTQQPSADCEPSKSEQKGIQEKGIGDNPSPSPQALSLAGPLSRDEARRALQASMRKFDWDNCPREAFDAALDAEIAEPGTGYAVISAAANVNWRAKRGKAG